MAVIGQVVSVTTTATKLSIDEDQLHNALEYGRDWGVSVLVKVPTGGSTIYVGGSGVTSSQTAGTGKGFPVAAGESVAIDLNSADDVLYAVTASGSQNVNVLESGV